MKGIFSKSKGVKAYKIVGLVSGVFLLVMFGLLLVFWDEKTLDDIIGSVFFCTFGTVEAVCCGISLFVDRRAFIHVDEGRIRAYCHFGFALDCKITDVRSVKCSAYGSMNIKLKNGKNYNLSHLKNGWELEEYIYARIPKEPAPLLDREKTMAQLQQLNKQWKPQVILAICAFVLVFPSILVAVWLTGERELHEFGSRDWMIFAIMGVAVVTLFVVFTLALRNYARYSDQFRELAGKLYQQVLRTTPPGPGNVLRMYVDAEVYACVRVTVYGYPNSECVYFTAEDVDEHYVIRTLSTSEVYPDLPTLMEKLGDDLTEIPIP